MAKKPSFARHLPSQHETDRINAAAKEAEEKEAAGRKQARLRLAFDEISKTEDGRLVLAWFHDRCGWVKPILIRLAGGDIAPLSTEAAAAQREVYRDARNYISRELLKKVEDEAEFGPVLQDNKKKGEK